MAGGYVSIDKLLLILEMEFKGAAQAKQVQKAIAEVERVATRATNNAQKGFRALQGALLGVGLSFLFTGMAIQRFFQNMLQQLLQNFMMIEGESGYVNNRINELLASLAFIGWQLMDIAVQTGVFDEWIDRVQRLVDWFGSLDEDTQKWIMNFIVNGVIVGAILMFVGQSLLGLLGVITLIAYIGLPLFLVLAIASYMVYQVWKILNGEGSNLIKFFKLLGVVALATLAIALIFGAALTLPIILAVLAVGAVIAAFVLLAQHLGGTKNAFKALGIFVLAILAAIGDAIFEAMILPIRAIIALINAAISASNRFLGTNIPEIKQPEFASLSKGVWEMRNNLLAEAESGQGQSTVNNNVTINGDVTGEGTLDKLKKQINEWFNFSNGSPQAGGAR